MINRRQALLGMSAAALGAAPSASALAGLLGTGVTGVPAANTPAKDAGSDAAVDDRLRKDLAQLDSRANSEEGVPVLLACVNLVAEKGSHRTSHAALTPFNTALTVEFRRNAAAWERVRPKSTAGDVGILIEVLAARDFNSGGKEFQS